MATKNYTSANGFNINEGEIDFLISAYSCYLTDLQDKDFTGEPGWRTLDWISYDKPINVKNLLRAKLISWESRKKADFALFKISENGINFLRDSDKIKKKKGEFWEPIKTQ